jgi:rod shape-determining protein MreC
MKLPYLSTSTDIVKGDLLVTSGLGGGFPPGYPVGVVTEVKRDPAQSLADVSVKPAAALDRARELLFVWLKDADLAAVPLPDAKPASPIVQPPATPLSKPVPPKPVPPKSAANTGATRP